MTWIALHWTDILTHLGLDLSGGFTLKCAIGACSHKRHQYAVWALGAVLISIATVMLVG